MEALTELWRLIAAFLPPEIVQPPGLYILIGLGVGAVIIGLVRRAARTGLSSHATRRDLSTMIRAGNFREAGRLCEAMGNTKKALDLYRRGNCFAELTTLLLALGRAVEAKDVARKAGLHGVYGELCRKDGAYEEAAIAFERDGKAFAAAQCYEQVGQKVRAARCYLAANLESKAVGQLEGLEGDQVGALLDEAIRMSTARTPGSALSLDMIAAVKRAVQLHLSAGKAEKAFRLAVDTSQFEIAVPIARDYLPPSEAAAVVCVRVGAHLAAAEIYRALERPRDEALQRAEHFMKIGHKADAAQAFETAGELAHAAELFAESGDMRHAAELYSRSGELEIAADIFGRLGDTERQMSLRVKAQSFSLSALDEDGDITVRTGATPISPRTLPTDEAKRYRLVEELGRGGMGIVYRAEDMVLRREVAYKVLPKDLFGAGDAEMLLSEARAAARLSHPNIVQVFDAGKGEQGYFVVMELVRGKSLDVLLRERALTVRGVLNIGQQICAALGHAHERRLVHRDLKPSNLMWSEEEKRLKLTDFGLARVLEERGKVQTQAAGTPSYMAPEQIRGEPVEPRTDLYSLGCVLYEMLCRRPIFSTGPKSIHQHLTEIPPDPRLVRGETPEALAELIARCLNKEVEKRPASAAEIAKELARISGTLKA